jgi:hypothetical protein
LLIKSLFITLNPTSVQAADFRLLEVRARDGTFFPPNEIVPEPASMVVFGVLALGGALVARRKLAKKVAVA